MSRLFKMFEVIQSEVILCSEVRHMDRWRNVKCFMNHVKQQHHKLLHLLVKPKEADQCFGTPERPSLPACSEL